MNYKRSICIGLAAILLICGCQQAPSSSQQETESAGTQSTAPQESKADLSYPEELRFLEKAACIRVKAPWLRAIDFDTDAPAAQAILSALSEASYAKNGAADDQLYGGNVIITALDENETILGSINLCGISGCRIRTLQTAENEVAPYYQAEGLDVLELNTELEAFVRETVQMKVPTADFFAEDFALFDGKKLTVRVPEGNNKDQAFCFPGTVIYSADTDESTEEVLKTMVQAVLDEYGREENREKYGFVITESRVDEQIYYPIGEGIWLVPSLNVSVTTDKKTEGDGFEKMMFLLAKQGNVYVFRQPGTVLAEEEADPSITEDKELAKALEDYFSLRRGDYAQGGQEAADPVHAFCVNGWASEKGITIGGDVTVSFVPGQLIRKSFRWIKLTVTETVTLPGGVSFETPHVLIVDRIGYRVAGDFYYEEETGYVPFLPQDPVTGKLPVLP